MEAKYILPAAPYVETKYEESFNFGAALTLLCQTAHSTFILFDAISRSISNHRERIRSLKENRRKDPVLVWSQSEHVEKLPDFENSSIPSITLAIELLYVFVVPFLILYYSNLQYREFVKFYQGGIVVYGNSEKLLSLDINNKVSGSEYSVAHWIHAKVERQGSKWIRPISVLLMSFVLSILGKQTYSMSCHREHQLDAYSVRKIVSFVRYLTHIIMLILPFDTYEDTYIKTREQLAQFFLPGENI